jgi:uncharacterized protein (DUF736 family)
MSDLIPLGGLWKNTSANGDSYLQGKLSPTVRILIFKNKYKTADNQPDFQIYLAPVPKPEGEGGRPESADADDFLGEETAPAPARSAAPAAARAAAPPARPAPAPARAAAPAGRMTRQTPEPPAEDFGDMEDPFAD